MTEISATAPRGPLLPPAPPAPSPLLMIGTAVDWAVVALGAAIISLVFLNVIFRVFHGDIAWTTELCEMLMVWVSFLGGASVTRRGGHMSITEFLDKLSTRNRLIADGFIQTAAACMLSLLVYYGWMITETAWGTVLSVLEVSMGYQYLALPVGSGLALLFVLFDLVQIARGVSRQQRYGS